ncbi:hypothetical protein BKA70DRAFT_1259958 [Coprinopsis sp. MPI-PUGE-AT-0042]|nr:hypothetical protein BKA70DRAFT_1259958 [Coprinopsis sp. MPI-PUGE-AT-0042]
MCAQNKTSCFPYFPSWQSLEILPGDWADWQLTSPNINASFPFADNMGVNLGIPQKTLYRMYLCCVEFPRSPTTDAGCIDAMEKTACIMICNPAHQTALNTRKRLMVLGKIAPEPELRLTELLLRGIKTCAKESALWDHRRWCIKRIYGHILANVDAALSLPTTSGWSIPQEASSLPNLPLEMCEREFAIIRTACSIYPRNYHAWTHWHYIMDACCASLNVADLQRPSTSHRDVIRIISQERRELEAWISCHVSDYSAVHQYLLLTRLQRTVLGCGEQFASTPLLAEEEADYMRPNSASQYFLKVLSDIQTRESLFLGLRASLSDLPDGERREVRQSVEDLRLPWKLR